MRPNKYDVSISQTHTHTHTYCFECVLIRVKPSFLQYFYENVLY